MKQGGNYARRKGAHWEREVAQAMRLALHKDSDAIHRGLQSRTGGDAPDVDAKPFWIECKKSVRVNLRGAIEQVLRDHHTGTLPIAIGRDDGAEPIAVLPFSIFLVMIEMLHDRVDSIEHTSYADTLRYLSRKISPSQEEPPDPPPVEGASNG